MTAKQSIIFAIVIAIAFFITMQVVYGQGQVNRTEGLVSIHNGCVLYDDNYLDKADVLIFKRLISGPETEECDWRTFADYFIQRNYTVIFDDSTAILMEGPQLK